MMRVLFSATMILTLSNCAMINTLRTGGSPAKALSEGLDSAAALKEGNAKCDALAKREVPYEEETQIGGSVVLALASKSGGVFIEPSPDLPSSAGVPDPKKWGGKKPNPGSGPKTDLNLYVNQLGKYLARSSSRPFIDWTFMVIDSPAPNAFSAPGGYVIVTTGLLDKIDNEAQLAFVLAHEIGHVVHRDAINQYKSTKNVVCRVVTVGQTATAGSSTPLERDFTTLMNNGFDFSAVGGEVIVKITDAVLDVIMKGNERQAELNADKTAFEIMVNSGYDVKEIEKLFGKIPDGAGWLTPHPSNADRVAAIKKVQDDFTKEYAGLVNLDTLKTPANETQLSIVKKK